MTSTQHTRTASLDELTLSMAPVILGAPALPRRSGEPKPRRRLPRSAGQVSPDTQRAAWVTPR